MTSLYSPGYHVYFDNPKPIFKARVNMAGTITYPVTEIVFDGVTLGAFGDLSPDMTLALGTTEGAWDLGIVRVHNFADSDSIPVGRISRGKERGSLNIQDNAYITVWEDFRVWSKIPRMIIDPDDEDTEITTFKDADIPVLSYTSQIPPVANSGPFFADYIDDDDETITVTFPMNGVDISYAVAEGATITDYLWDIEDGTLTGGSLTDATITATFPAGSRWVGLTVTDSNGKVHTSRTFVLAVDPADDVTYKDWASINFEMRKEGQVADIILNKNLPRNTYPNGALVLVWKDGASSPGSRQHMKFCGWQESDNWNVTGTRKGMTRNASVKCYDVGQRLSVLPGFPQALERSDEIAWEYMEELTMNRVLDYLWRWHTTAGSVADVILPADDDYPLMRRDTGASNIFDQLASTSRMMVPANILVCTPQGQLIFQEDWMEIDVGDRPAVGMVLQEQDIADIQAEFNAQPRVHSLHQGAMKTTEDWVIIGGEKTLPLLFSIAPGDAFSQGTTEVVQGEGLAKSQEDLNMVTGHRYARMNAEYGPFSITLANSPDFWEYSPSLFVRVQLNLSAAYASQRGLEFTSQEGQIVDARLRLNNTAKGYTAAFSFNWEAEVDGPPAQTYIPEEAGEPDGGYETPPPVPTVPPGIGTGESRIAGIGLDGYVYRTNNFQAASPVWDRQDTGIADTIYSWVVDPFSPKYISGSGTVDGWIANDTAIYRVTDLFGTVDAEAVFTFDTATDPGEFHWRQISASFGAFFGAGSNPWLMCVSYYGDTVGKLGVWVTYSTDKGVTWTEEAQIGAAFAETPDRFFPVALWMSPRTPGKAYTISLGGGAFDPDLVPIWGIVLDGASSATYTAPSPSIDVAGSVTLVGISSDNDGKTVVMIPPANTVRVELEGHWAATSTIDEALGTPQINFALSIDDPASISTVETMTFDTPDIDPPASDTNSQTFSLTWTYGGGGDWPVNRTSIVGTPLTGPGTPAGARMQITLHGTSSDPTFFQSGSLELSLRVVEIEFDGGIIYNPPVSSPEMVLTGDWGATWVAPGNLVMPGAGFAGTIHVPWADNATQNHLLYGFFEKTTVREFRLKKLDAGVETDISPDGEWGVNRGPFGVRSYTSDRDILVACVMKNESSLDAADDEHAVFVSDDGGATWDQIVAPIPDSAAPTNRPAFEAEFSGSSPSVIFIWGPPDYMSYTEDFGASVLDKSGNLSSFSMPGFVGIAGGSS